MIRHRLLRAAKRTLRRLVQPLRLRWIDYLHAQSASELLRLTEIREDLLKLECNEHFHQVQLSVRRDRIARGACMKFLLFVGKEWSEDHQGVMLACVAVCFVLGLIAAYPT